MKLYLLIPSRKDSEAVLKLINWYNFINALLKNIDFIIQLRV